MGNLPARPSPLAEVGKVNMLQRFLAAKADRMKSQGYDPVLIKPKGCPLKAKPHVCANCGTREGVE